MSSSTFAVCCDQAYSLAQLKGVTCSSQTLLRYVIPYALSAVLPATSNARKAQARKGTQEGAVQSVQAELQYTFHLL